MKLVIQIPCYNEADSLPKVFSDLPRTIEGIDQIEWVVIDDGSTDNTAAVAKSLGADHVLSLKKKNRRWLGRAFRLGTEFALEHGADIVVNTDGDGQYPSSAISALVRPILDGQADIVIGNRNPRTNREFSPHKRLLTIFGGHVVSILSGENSPDVLSGFRAYDKAALEQLHVLSNYTYTIDTLMQAHKKGLDVGWIDIHTNPSSRPSRLFRSSWDAVFRSAPNILRLFSLYQSARILMLFSAVFLCLGIAIFGRFIFLYLWIPEQARGHIQSLVIGGVSILASVQMAVLAILGDILNIIRAFSEEILRLLKRQMSEQIRDEK